MMAGMARPRRFKPPTEQPAKPAPAPKAKRSTRIGNREASMDELRAALDLPANATHDDLRAACGLGAHASLDDVRRVVAER